jgi:hypothetical protein
MITLAVFAVIVMIALAIWAFIGLARRSRTGHPQRSSRM